MSAEATSNAVAMIAPILGCPSGCPVRSQPRSTASCTQPLSQNSMISHAWLGTVGTCCPDSPGCDIMQPHKLKFPLLECPSMPSAFTGPSSKGHGSTPSVLPSNPCCPTPVALLPSLSCSSRRSCCCCCSCSQRRCSSCCCSRRCSCSCCCWLRDSWLAVSFLSFCERWSMSRVWGRSWREDLERVCLQLLTVLVATLFGRRTTTFKMLTMWGCLSSAPKAASKDAPSSLTLTSSLMTLTATLLPNQSAA
mmetsp:Transcript_3862/g.10493  ORF Transcript_3862/g.10493 Transcript_3862/m.10493 type:complete len:250 (-) Transcript_3862:1583-2332(-)